MTPQEEKLVLELHAKWGNRWSRIARKLPGRTDNEIKNYWRTHMRKKAQERKRAMSPSLSSSNASSFITTVDSFSPFPETDGVSFYDTGGNENMVAGAGNQGEAGKGEKGNYSLDDIWKDIENTMEEPFCDGFSEEVCNFSAASIASPIWEYCPDTLWKMMDAEEGSKMFLPYDYGTFFLTG